MYSPETNARIVQLRVKCAEDTITEEELAEAASLLRGERISAVRNAAKRRSTAARAVRSAEDLLGELEGL